jgi:tRNA-specific 2-thiouridylase
MSARRHSFLCFPGQCVKVPPLFKPADMKVAVLLSGGVDSSVALHLAKQEGGHELAAFYLKIWLEEELAFLGDCPWEEDLKFARAVCEQAGVPLQIVSLQTEYQERVVAHVLNELKRGRTPSPDILCNQWVKFGLFFDKIDAGFDKVVSGHYAQIEQRDGTYLLKRSPDPIKDQTYFLHALNQTQLSRLWFPIGHLTKPAVRKLANDLSLPNRDRKDSQGICFLGKIRYPEFVRFHLGEKVGDIVEFETGRKLAEHHGVWFYTIGQRKGLGLSGGPWYVVKKDLEVNTLYVSHSDHFLTHARKQFTVDEVRWIAGEPTGEAGDGRWKREDGRSGPQPSSSIFDLQSPICSLLTKVRHGPHLEPCAIRPLGGARWEVTLENPDQGIAPGQSAIFYEGEICLGGGVIE